MYLLHIDIITHMLINKQKRLRNTEKHTNRKRDTGVTKGRWIDIESERERQRNKEKENLYSPRNRIQIVLEARREGTCAPSS